jgi:formylmethanofuran dehydrogenase subunit E
MLLGYQRMPASDLFDFQPVTLKQPVSELVSHANARAICDQCGEEILNEREVKQAGHTLCQACANGAYYTPKA